jgi:hypothetical protein
MWFIIHEIPRNSMGKINKKQLSGLKDKFKEIGDET